ncbi:MAG: DUF1540 domain-containing protein [Clostridia bacterium]|nr:DUF1540 domain-containing protein [Clostridia bacterium]
MSKSKVGCQTIGCSVTSCRFNDEGSYCKLNRIEVEPCYDCGTGKPADESLCGSYQHK